LERVLYNIGYFLLACAAIFIGLAWFAKQDPDERDPDEDPEDRNDLPDE
jgi:hypothetical protein